LIGAESNALGTCIKDSCLISHAREEKNQSPFPREWISGVKSLSMPLESVFVVVLSLMSFRKIER
jgi:hypothetical protein